MLHDFYDIDTEPLFTLKDFCGEKRHIVDKCLIVFSKRIHDYLLENYDCEEIGDIKACNGSTPVYAFGYKGERIAFYLTAIGPALASSFCYEAHWRTGATKFMMFGSCGSLAREKTDGHFIVPTESYRGEGCSFYYAPPADYIRIKNAEKLAAVFGEMGVPHVTGRVWTTETMLRETRGLIARRREEGCIAVEMELSAVQAVCDFYGLELFDFLEAGDVLSDSGYEVEGLNAANHDLGKLFVALEALSRL